MSVKDIPDYEEQRPKTRVDQARIELAQLLNERENWEHLENTEEPLEPVDDDTVTAVPLDEVVYPDMPYDGPSTEHAVTKNPLDNVLKIIESNIDVDEEYEVFQGIRPERKNSDEDSDYSKSDSIEHERTQTCGKAFELVINCICFFFE